MNTKTTAPLRDALSDWATRSTPWTGSESMSAEDGYNAAIEEVVAIINDSWQDDLDHRVSIEKIAAEEAVTALAKGITAALTIRLVSGDTGQTYNPTEVATIVGEVVDHQLARFRLANG